MFVVKPEPTFAADVEIPVPGGAIKKLKVLYRHKSRSGLQDYFKRASEMTVLQANAEIIAGWEEADEPFSLEALERLLDDYHNSEEVLLDRYVTELRQARRGN